MDSQAPQQASLHIWPTVWTDRAWWSVEDSARLLRVHTGTLYDACASGSFPHKRFGEASSWFIRVPCEALRLRLRPEIRERTYNIPDDTAQLELPLDISCLIPVKRYRNTRELIDANDYERALWSGRPVQSHWRRSEKPVQAPVTAYEKTDDQLPQVFVSRAYG